MNLRNDRHIGFQSITNNFFNKIKMNCNTMAKTKHFANMDVAKGICMLLVFLAHSVLYFPVDYSKMYFGCNRLTEAISSFFMPCFFFVSGFLYYASKKGYKEMVSDKVRRLLVPYLFVCAITLLVKIIKPSIAFATFSSFEDYLEYYLLNGGDRWFLYLLFVMFLVVGTFKRYLTSDFKIILCLFITYVVAICNDKSYCFLLVKGSSYMIYFLWGFLARRHYEAFLTFVRKWKLFICLSFLLCNCIFIGQFHILIRGIFLPLIGISFTLLISDVIAGCKNKIVLLKEAFTYVGKYSLQYYVFTGFVLVIARIIVINVFGFINPWIVIPLVFIIQIILATLGVNFTKKYSIFKIPFGY